MTPQPLRDMMDPGWAEALEPVEPKIREMGAFLRAEVAAGRTYLPSGDLVLRAFQQPFTGIRVLIVGQDPYPTPGNPVGLSFSVPPKPDPGEPDQHLQGVLRGPRLPAAVERGPEPVDRARHHAAEPGADRSAGPRPRTAARAGRPSPTRPSPPWPAGARRWSRSCGAATRAAWSRCWPATTRSPGSSPPTPARTPRTAASSAPARSAAPTSCWRKWAPTPSTGSCPN